MAVQRTTRADIRRLLVLLSLAWATTWVLGIGVVATVAINLSNRLQQQDLDAQLSLYATAAYGLAWFDADGQFHDDLVLLETELFDGFADIWVIEPGETPVFHLAPQLKLFQLDSLADVAQQVVTQESEMTANGRDAEGASYRLYAIPTYKDGNNEPHAAVIVVGDPAPGASAHLAFVTGLTALAVTIGIIGLLVGTGLAWLSLNPARAALEKGERFLVAAAHELRTPVASLRAVCESGLAGDESAAAALQRAARVAETTGDVVEDLLLFARLDAGEAHFERQKLRLDLLVELCVPDGAPVDVERNASVVEADSRLVKVAVRNLIQNSLIHANSSSERVRVTVTGATVVVEDGGAGFPARILSLARRPFSIAPSDHGAGIGLATCRMIAELHGGGLELKNRPQGGASASLRLA